MVKEEAAECEIKDIPHLKKRYDDYPRPPSCYHDSLGNGWEVVEKYISVHNTYEWRQTYGARYSTTLKSERLTDAQCVNRLQTGIIIAIIKTITAARYRKGYGMLERYEGKLSRTVLRGFGAGNGLRLLGDLSETK